MKTTASLPMHTLLFTAFMLLLPQSLLAESYHCQAEQLAGFVYNPDEKSWNGGGSPTEASFTVISQNKEGTKSIGAKWFVSEKGKDFGMTCSDDFDAAGFLHCRGLGGDFLMNKKTKRFRYLLDKGYVVEHYTRSSPEGRHSPHMKIGSCKPD